MITDSIQELLGQELTEQVVSALKGRGKDGKDIDLVIGNDGSFVPADKYDLLKGQAASAEKALKSAAEALKAIGGSGDPAKIADDVQAAQAALTTLQTDHQAEIKRLQKNTALRVALADKAHDPADIISLLDLDKISVDDSGALTSDLGELLKPYQEAKPYLFKEQEPANPDIKGAKPADAGTRPEPAALTSGPIVI